MVWNFIGVYIINRTLHGRLEIRNISVRPRSILYLFTSKQRKAGSKKGETGKTSGRFYFQDGAKSNGGRLPYIYNYFVSRRLSLSVSIYAQRKAGSFSSLVKQNRFTCDFLNLTKSSQEDQKKSGFNSTGRSSRAVFSYRILYSAVV